MEWQHFLSGRELIDSEIPEQWIQIIRSSDQVQTHSAFIERKNKMFCRRCGEEIKLMKPTYCLCNKPCGYCHHCIQMGKVKVCSQFYSLPEVNDFKYISSSVCHWDGTLSEQQAAGAQDMLASVKNGKDRLLWAVTGAGKTEMLFPVINYSLQNSWRICLASPRVDVCLELSPRLKQAFPKIDIAVLHGDNKEGYRYTQLVIATTHQLLRFKKAFDVLIIDEIDAFPFHNSQMLQRAAQKARKKSGSVIYLTATPSKSMRVRVKNKQLPATILPARYHRHALPVPQLRFIKEWRTKLLHTKNNDAVRQMKLWLDKGQRFLVFVPSIAWMARWTEQMKKWFPDTQFTSISAEDSLRQEKVMAFRNGDYQFLIVSTILERGVTFSQIQVMVLGAEDSIFTCSALVQIAGRAGRSLKYPTGEVIFYHYGLTRDIKAAIKQIKKMNQLALKKGLIDQ